MRPIAAALALLCALALSACASTVVEQPIGHSQLEGLIMSPFPVYWLGNSFQGLDVSETSKDPSGAQSLRYGNCLEGSQGSCVAPLRIVTSADNSFLPGGTTHAHSGEIRGVAVQFEQHGRTIVIATGAVVVDIYADSEALARAAAETAVPINEAAAVGAQLPPRLPDSGYAEEPLPTQEPTPLRPVR